jgi:hypothetical protein
MCLSKDHLSIRYQNKGKFSGPLGNRKHSLLMQIMWVLPAEMPISGEAPIPDTSLQLSTLRAFHTGTGKKHAL